MKRIACAFSLAAMAGCAFMRGGAHESAPPPPVQVSEADFSRLAPDDMGPVNEAREFLATAREEQGRAKLRQQETMHEADLAKANQQAADSDEKRAATQAMIANDSREPAQVEQARQFPGAGAAPQERGRGARAVRGEARRGAEGGRAVGG